MSLAGTLTFGRYAFAPYQLGYCGPDDNAALFQYVAERTPDQGLVELERRFKGAYPYLCLIAHANGIADPFDERVVDAYWIGNSLLDGVEAKAFHQSMSGSGSVRVCQGRTSRCRLRPSGGGFRQSVRGC